MIPSKLISELRQTKHLVVLTGAGVSAESGVPTFREAQTGLWSKYDPSELATPAGFARDPRLVWQWYSWRRRLVTQATPNEGHLALAAMESYFQKLTLITQNVDGLHARAGSSCIIELHGNIMRTRCSLDGDAVVEWDDTSQQPPRCPRCDGLLRPDVVWFGENLSQELLRTAFEAAKNCDLLLSVGTSSVVQPAASLPLIAARHGAVCAEINPLLTPISHQMDYTLNGPAGHILPEIVRSLPVSS